MCDATVVFVTSSVCTSSFTHNRNSGFGQEAQDIGSFYWVIFVIFAIIFQEVCLSKPQSPAATAVAAAERRQRHL